MTESGSPPLKRTSHSRSLGAEFEKLVKDSKDKGRERKKDLRQGDEVDVEISDAEQGGKGTKGIKQKRKEEWRNLFSEVNEDGETGNCVIDVDTSKIGAQEFQSLLYFCYTGSYRNSWTGKGRYSHEQRTQDAEELCKWLQKLEITRHSRTGQRFHLQSRILDGWGKGEVEEFHGAVSAIAHRVLLRNLHTKALNNRWLSDGNTSPIAVPCRSLISRTFT